MGRDFLTDHQVVNLFVPVADAFAGGQNGDVIKLADFERVTFFVFTGAIEDANISNLVTVEACDDATPTNTTAMAFTQRALKWSTTVDTWAAQTAAAAAGFNFATANAVADAIWMVEVTAAAVSAAQAGFEFVRMVIAETANKTVTAGGIAILSGARYPTSIPKTVQS